MEFNFLKRKTFGSNNYKRYFPKEGGLPHRYPPLASTQAANVMTYAVVVYVANKVVETVSMQLAREQFDFSY